MSTDSITSCNFKQLNTLWTLEDYPFEAFNHAWKIHPWYDVYDYKAQNMQAKPNSHRSYMSTSSAT
jgi:hypothetical protein